MENFVFRNPTKLIFGRGQIARIGQEIPTGARIMMTYGGGSIFKNGIYDQVKAAIKGSRWLSLAASRRIPNMKRCCEGFRWPGTEDRLFVGSRRGVRDRRDEVYRGGHPLSGRFIMGYPGASGK